MAELDRAATLLSQVIAVTSGGERLRSCLQCGTCSGSCPNSPDMDHTPRALFALLLGGEREQVLESNTPWMCVSCYACTVRCPREIPITELMYTLKRISADEGYASNDALALAQNFSHYIEKYGRSFEFGLATRFYLTRRPTALFGLGPLGMRMLRHGRMQLKPSRIQALGQLQAILKKARQLEEPEPVEVAS